MKKIYSQAGFTLIELLVVISIIALLSSVILVALSGARNGARNAKMTQEVDQMRIQLETTRAGGANYTVLTPTGDAVVFSATTADTTLTTLINDIAAQNGAPFLSTAGEPPAASVGIVISTDVSSGSPKKYAIYIQNTPIGTNANNIWPSGYYCADSSGNSILSKASVASWVNKVDATPGSCS